MDQQLWYAVAVGGVAVAVSVTYHAARRRAFERLCAARSWRPATVDEMVETEGVRDAEGVEDLVAGEHEGRRFWAGARVWTSRGTGSKPSKHHERLVVFELAERLPSFSAEHTSRFLEAIFGAEEDGIEIPEDPAFSDRWRVKADRPDAARMILGAGVRRVLASQQCGIRVSGRRFAWWESGRLLWPSAYDGMVTAANEVRRALEDAAAEVRMTPGAAEALAEASRSRRR